MDMLAHLMLSEPTYLDHPLRSHRQQEYLTKYFLQHSSDHCHYYTTMKRHAGVSRTMLLMYEITSERQI